MKHSANFYVRRTHRYLGVFIGIQFFLWTLGGFYFSWMNIQGIRGEDLAAAPEPQLSFSASLVSPDEAVRRASETYGALEINKIALTTILEAPYYEITGTDGNGNPLVILADAVTGIERGEITQVEAVRIARDGLKQQSEFAGADYVTGDAVGSHSEYRGQPLPAWAVNFSTPKEFTVYVAAATGRIQAVRTRNWRIFDFLWMLHTMDYNGRDDINNYVLRAFSILGIITISSGFLLFAMSSPYLRKRRRSKR